MKTMLAFAVLLLACNHDVGSTAIGPGNGWHVVGDDTGSGNVTVMWQVPGEPQAPTTDSAPEVLDVTTDLGAPADTTDMATATGDDAGVIVLDGGAPPDSGLAEVPCPKLAGNSYGQHCFLSPKH